MRVSDHPPTPTTPARPFLPGFYRVIPMGNDAVQLRSAGRVVRLAGPGVGEFGPLLLDALDGWQDLPTIVERLGLVMGPVTDLVGQLHAQGVITDVDTDDHPAPRGHASEVYAELGAHPGDVHAALAGACVAILGLGPVARSAARHLASAGAGEIRLVDDGLVTSTDQVACAGPAAAAGRSRTTVASQECAAVAPTESSSVIVARTGDLPGVVAGCDLVVVEVDEGRARASEAAQACLDAGVAALFHSASTLRATVGPMVVPGTPGCLECLELRRLSHLRHHDEDVAYRRWLESGGAPRQPAMLSGFTSVVAGLVSVEVLRKVGGIQPPVISSAVLTAVAGTSEVRREPLLPVPGCPGCGGGPAGPGPALPSSSAPGAA